MTSLTIALNEAAVVRWSVNGWANPVDTATHPGGLGIHVVDIDTGGREAGDKIIFTFRRDADKQWAGADFEVAVN